jgi:SAM-dependent methyltransferase
MMSLRDLKRSVRNLKRAVGNQVRRLPGEGRVVINAYRELVLLRRRADTKLRAWINRDAPHLETVYWIDPQRIVYLTNYVRRGHNAHPKDRVFDRYRDKGKVYGGSWDDSDLRFDDLEIVRALRARVEDGVEWRATAFYSNMRAELERHTSRSWGLRSVSDLDERCEYLDRLIESIRRNGFKLSHEVRLDGEDKGVAGHPLFGSEILVNISRNGHYLFQDGRHRLAIAKILAFPRVPVKVLVRHAQWIEFRHFVKSLARGGGASSQVNHLYQNPVHPDLQDIPSVHGCEDRFNAIKKVVGSNGGALLDIGANLGYFCHRFEDLGYDCFAVELLPQIALAAERIRIAESKKFQVISKDLFTATSEAPLRDRKFNVVLALNIFHHFLKERETFEKFVEWLRALNMDSMILEPHCTDEQQMTGAYRNFPEREFVEFVLANSVLGHAEVVHRCEDRRPIYRLWR